MHPQPGHPRPADAVDNARWGDHMGMCRVPRGPHGWSGGSKTGISGKTSQKPASFRPKLARNVRKWPFLTLFSAISGPLRGLSVVF